MRVSWVALVILKLPGFNEPVNAKLPFAAQLIVAVCDPTLVPLTAVGVAAPPPEHVIALEIAEPV